MSACSDVKCTKWNYVPKSCKLEMIMQLTSYHHKYTVALRYIMDEKPTPNLPHFCYQSTKLISTLVFRTNRVKCRCWKLELKAWTRSLQWFRCSNKYHGKSSFQTGWTWVLNHYDILLRRSHLPCTIAWILAEIWEHANVVRWQLSLIDRCNFIAYCCKAETNKRPRNSRHPSPFATRSN